VSFDADEHAAKDKGEFTVTPEYVKERVSPMMVKSDLSRYML
jgi:ATP-dependent protease HslVU (ClpYQ) ATPase subunit